MKRRVLIVDDEPKIVKVLSLNLKLSGHEVATTTSGAEAVEMIRNEAPDVVLLDLIMPRMDGFQVIREVRTFSSVPIIVLSASPERAESAMRLGANGSIGKPFVPEELVARIKEVATAAHGS